MYITSLFPHQPAPKKLSPDKSSCTEVGGRVLSEDRSASMGPEERGVRAEGKKSTFFDSLADTKKPRMQLGQNI